MDHDRSRDMKNFYWALPLFLASLASFGTIMYLAGQPPQAPAVARDAGWVPCKRLAVECPGADRVWQACTDTDGRLTLVRGRGLDDIRTDLDGLVEALNPLAHASSGGDTCARTRGSLLLAGTHGEVAKVRLIPVPAGAYGIDNAAIAEIIFTLTEHPGIRYVMILGQEDGQDLPQIYSRQDMAAAWRVEALGRVSR